MVSAYTTYEVPGTLKSYVVSETTPAPKDQNLLWQKLDGSGNPDRIYVFASGSWLSKHPDFVGKVVEWEGDISTIATLDGGSVGAITATTGPFWEEVTECVGRFGIHPDPGGALLTVPVAVGDTGGEEKHLLTLDEIPAHTHLTTKAGLGGNSGNNFFVMDLASSPDIPSSSVGGSQPHNNMPPYYGIYKIRRTARQFYVG